MAPSESLGKRPAASRGTSHVSEQMTALPKRPRSQCQDTPPTSTNQFKELQKAWSEFESDVNAALLEFRAPALDEIAKALSRVPEGGQVPAVCVNMGAAAAAGDRAGVFDSILDHVHSTSGATVLRFQSGHHSTMNAVTQHFKTVEEDEAIVVAVEDADLFPEDTLRDLVYLCGKRRKLDTVQAGEVVPEKYVPPVAILFGLGTSPDSLHSALGIQEATVIMPTNIDMPHATACFKVIVEKVLSVRKHPILLSQAAYDLIETEFFARESTVAVVMRYLHQIYTTHFYREPVAAPFSRRKFLMSRGLDVELNDTCLGHMRNKIESVRNELEAEPCDDVELYSLALKWHDTLCTWRSRCRIVEQVVYQLMRVLQAPERGWTKERPNHSDLRLHIFRAFLVTEDTDRSVDTRSIGRMIATRIGKSSRQQLLKFATAMKESMKSCEVEDDEEINDSLERLSDLTDDLEKVDQHASIDKEEESTIADSVSSRRTFAKGGAAAKQRRAEMLKNAQEVQKASSVLKGPRGKLAAIFKDFIELVEPLGTLPMYEVALFSDTQALQELSGGLGGAAEPRTSFFRAMRQPSKLLGSLSDSSIPDTAIAYRLLAEGGRMKNLYDWYHTFSTMRVAGAVERDENGNITGLKDVSQAETQVRFSRVCTELEFLGLLKHTNRKTDHVLRLTFE